MRKKNNTTHSCVSSGMNERESERNEREVQHSNFEA